eukprot:Hpha_TRINITY_DN16980_c1_g2::TRINITY_DN16980_c1_g2_i2::g.54305::m.54305
MKNKGGVGMRAGALLGLLGGAAAQCVTEVEWCRRAAGQPVLFENTTLAAVGGNCTYHSWTREEIRERMAGQWLVMGGTSVANVQISEQILQVDPQSRMWCDQNGGMADYIWDRDGNLVTHRSGRDIDVLFACAAVSSKDGPNGFVDNEAIKGWLTADVPVPEGGFRITWVLACFWDQMRLASQWIREMEGGWGDVNKVFHAHVTSSYYWFSQNDRSFRPYLMGGDAGKSARELKEQVALLVDEGKLWQARGWRAMLVTKGTRGFDQRSCDGGWFDFDEYSNEVIREFTGPDGLELVDSDEFTGMMPQEFQDMNHVSNLLAYWQANRLWAALAGRDGDKGCPEVVTFGSTCSALTLTASDCTANYCAPGQPAWPDNSCWLRSPSAPPDKAGCCDRSDGYVDFMHLTRRPCDVNVTLTNGSASNAMHLTPQESQDLLPVVLGEMAAAPHSKLPCQMVWCEGEWAQVLLGLLGLAVAIVGWIHSVRKRWPGGRPPWKRAPPKDSESAPLILPDLPIVPPVGEVKGTASATADLKAPQEAPVLLEDVKAPQEAVAVPVPQEAAAAPVQKAPQARPKGGAERLEALGFARFVASVHIVAGHFYEELRQHSYVAGWGYTWVPWFFMLSGYVLTHARLNSRNPAEVQKPAAFLVRRLATVFPMYAAGLLVSFLLATKQSLPEPRVLVAQSWFVQSYYPGWTEQTLQSHCWFLSSMTLYWITFPFVYPLVLKIPSARVTFRMIVLVMLLPWIMPAIALWTGSNQEWYESHKWGSLESPTDYWIVVLKFHPICYFHMFFSGMLLAKMRWFMKKAESLHPIVQALNNTSVVIAYAGLALIFCVRQIAPPGHKLTARLGLLMPLQALLMHGLAWGGDPLAKLFGSWGLVVFEEWSYVQYILQFIAFKLWPSDDVSILFFFFLLGMTVFCAKFINEPANKWWMKNLKNVWIVPVLLTLILVLPSEPLFSDQLQRDGRPSVFAADRIEIAGDMVDTRLQLFGEEPLRGVPLGEDKVINPSIIPWEGGFLLTARRHSVAVFNSTVTQEMIWLSQMAMGRLEKGTTYGDYIPAGGLDSLETTKAGSCCVQTGLLIQGELMFYKSDVSASYSECCARCKATQDCTAWTWCAKEEPGICNNRLGNCLLMSGTDLVPSVTEYTVGGYVNPPNATQRHRLRAAGFDIEPGQLEQCGDQAWNICQKRPVLSPVPAQAPGSISLITGAEDPKLINTSSGPRIAFNSLPVAEEDGTCGTAAVATMFTGNVPTPGMNSPVGVVSMATELRPPTDYITCVPCEGLKCRKVQRPQKNWIAFEYENEMHYIQNIDPWEVTKCSVDGTCTRLSRQLFLSLTRTRQRGAAARTGTSLKARTAVMKALPVGNAELELHGGSAAVKLPDSTFVALIHTVDMTSRRYVNFAVRFGGSPPFAPIEISDPLPLTQIADDTEYAFAFGSGLALDGENVMFAYGAGDKQSRILTMSLARFQSMFPSGRGAPDTPPVKVSLH